jgi:hypothetical protein
MIPQSFLPKTMDYSTDMKFREEGPTSDPLLQKFFLNLLLPAVIKSIIVYMIITWAFGVFSFLKTFTVLIYLSTSNL